MGIIKTHNIWVKTKRRNSFLMKAGPLPEWPWITPSFPSRPRDLSVIAHWVGRLFQQGSGSIAIFLFSLFWCMKLQRFWFNVQLDTKTYLLFRCDVHTAITLAMTSANPQALMLRSKRNGTPNRSAASLFPFLYSVYSTCPPNWSF